MLLTILTILHVLIAFVLVGLILVQRGKGADAGAAFGSGGSSTVFGARGSASFLSRATAILAIMFFSNIMALGYLTTTVSERKSLMEQPLFEVQDMKWEEKAGKPDKEADKDGKAKEPQDGANAQTPPRVSASPDSDGPPDPEAPSPVVPESQGGASTAAEAAKPVETEPSDMPEMPK
ncbi:MAG: preprotein translocase subunit SecG [Gammaproteobacteria bacterium]